MASHEGRNDEEEDEEGKDDEEWTQEHTFFLWLGFRGTFIPVKQRGLEGSLWLFRRKLGGEKDWGKKWPLGFLGCNVWGSLNFQIAPSGYGRLGPCEEHLSALNEFIE
jgi:hypothetical protein